MLYRRLHCPNDEGASLCPSCHVGGACEGWMYVPVEPDYEAARTSIIRDTLYFGTEECGDPLGGHVFDYGAHNASIDNPYKCFSCDAALIPVVPLQPKGASLDEEG